jgi:hypothetical protein
MHPPFPSGVERHDGWIVLTEAWRIASQENRDTTTLGVQRVSIHGQEWMLLDTMVARLPDGRASWQVVDAMRLPAPPDSAGIVVDCFHRDWPAIPGEVFAIGKWPGPSEQYVPVVHRAWKIDVRDRRFVEIRVDGVWCHNEGYGT